jgi:hypothetical protein
VNDLGTSRSSFVFVHTPARDSSSSVRSFVEGSDHGNLRHERSGVGDAELVLADERHQVHAERLVEPDLVLRYAVPGLLPALLEVTLRVAEQHRLADQPEEVVRHRHQRDELGIARPDQIGEFFRFQIPKLVSSDISVFSELKSVGSSTPDWIAELDELRRYAFTASIPFEIADASAIRRKDLDQLLHSIGCLLASIS